MRNHFFNLSILFTIFLCLVSGLAQAQKHVDRIIRDLDQNPQKILVVAHRAAHQHHPENSIAAIKAAIDIGADIVEIDVRGTRDGELVLMHDKSIDRTTGDTGLVSQYTYAELKDKRLLWNGQPGHETIPTLREALKTARGHIMVDIDFKLDSANEAIKVYNLIQELQMEDQVIFYIYNQYDFIPQLQKLNSRIRIMPRAYSKDDMENILKNYNVKIIHIDDSFYDEKLMQKVRRKNIRIWSNALGTYDRMERENKNSGYDALLKMKAINIIQTDDPAGLINYLEEKGNRR